MTESCPPARSPTETAGLRFPDQYCLIIFIFYNNHGLTSTDVASKAGNSHHGQSKSQGYLVLGLAVVKLSVRESNLCRIAVTTSLLHSSPTTEYDQQHRAQELSHQTLQQRYHFQVFFSNGIPHVSDISE